MEMVVKRHWTYEHPYNLLSLLSYDSFYRPEMLCPCCGRMISFDNYKFHHSNKQRSLDINAIVVSLKRGHKKYILPLCTDCKNNTKIKTFRVNSVFLYPYEHRRTFIGYYLHLDDFFEILDE